MKTKTITVNVTAKDIKNGLRNNCYFCPIARAFKRLKLIKYKNASINSTKVQLILDNQIKSFWLPDSAINFIKDFDEGKSVKPFKFKMEIEF